MPLLTTLAVAKPWRPLLVQCNAVESNAVETGHDMTPDKEPSPDKVKVKSNRCYGGIYLMFYKFKPAAAFRLLRSSGAPKLPATSLTFPDPLYTRCGFGALRRSAQPTTQFAFFQDVVDVYFDCAGFNAQRARYFAICKLSLGQQRDFLFPRRQAFTPNPEQFFSDPIVA